MKIYTEKFSFTNIITYINFTKSYYRSSNVDVRYKKEVL